MMNTLFYAAVKDFGLFDELIREQRDNPTRDLNIMLRQGTTRSQIEAFIKERRTKQFSTWSGVGQHVRYCEGHGWRFSLDFEDFRWSSGGGEKLTIIGFQR